MTDGHSHVPRAKGRSASICGTGSSSLEAIPPTETGTPQSRRRRPATRSQSARLNNNRSIRRRTAMTSTTTATNSADLKNHCNSEPKLAEQSETTPDVSPNIRRKGSTRRGTSVYHRKSTAFLDVPDSRGGVKSGDEDEDSYRLRSFSFTSKGYHRGRQTDLLRTKSTPPQNKMGRKWVYEGDYSMRAGFYLDNIVCHGIINRGDSFRRRRSRSNSLCPPSMGGCTPSPVLGFADSGVPVSSYVVALLGAQGVGKTALISQFMTSECINAYDRQKDFLGAQTVSIMLNGEESELTFQNVTNSKEIDKLHPPDAFVVLFSVVDKASFLKAEAELTKLQDGDLLRSRSTIIVGNKIDLARSRAVSTQDGKCLACTFRAKFIEISVGINHNVDELLVGILTQIRLKVLNHEDRDHQQQWYKSRGVLKASMKARQMFTWLFGKEDSKFKNCENLHIL